MYSSVSPRLISASRLTSQTHTHPVFVQTRALLSSAAQPKLPVSYLTVVLVQSILNVQLSSPSRAGVSYLQSRSISTPDPEIHSILQEAIMNINMVMHLSLKSPSWLRYLSQYLFSVNKFLSSIPGLPFPNFTQIEVPPQNPTSFPPRKRPHVSPGNSLPSQRPPLNTGPQGTTSHSRTAPPPALTLLDR